MSTRMDAVVVGSGASGSVMAYELVRRGLTVTVLEAGARHDPSSFEHDELAMFTRMYKLAGLQSTADRQTSIIQGAAVGGSTVINNAIWMRADLRGHVLPSWRKAGAPVEEQALTGAYQELEKALHVSPLPQGTANRGAQVFMRGARALDIPAEYLNNNRRQCLGCGWCNYGCRYNRKTSMLVTYVPWAENRGATFIDRCADVRFESRSGRVLAVTARRDGQELRYLPDVVVVCAGAVGSSELLLRNGVNPHGRTGRGLHALGGLFVSADCDKPVDGFDGIGLCCVAKADPRYVLESYFAPPVAFSLRTAGFFEEHHRRMSRYRYFADAGVMVGTDPENGRVTLDRRGRAKIRLTFDSRDVQRLKEGTKTLTRIFLAGGAKAVYPSTYRAVELTSPADLSKVDAEISSAADLTLGTAHPQGGNTMSEDPSRGVVAPDFQVHSWKNLFVADTSVWPSNIWVNCQATAMAMAHYAAGHVVRLGGRR